MSGANFVGEELYERLNAYLIAHMNGVRTSAEQHVDESLLRFYFKVAFFFSVVPFFFSLTLSPKGVGSFYSSVEVYQPHLSILEPSLDQA